MLYPRATPTRERISLNGLWAFALDPDGRGRDERWWQGLPASAIEMPVPASYNDVIPDAAYRDHVGEVWYATEVQVPASWEGQRVVLRFGSATHHAEVWVDDARVVA